VKKLKEYYGTQRPSFAGGPGAGSNFYSGRDLGTHTKGSLGTRGADSNFSRRMQALVPNDYYELLEDEVIDFDEDVVVENSRYSLQKTLEINEGVFSNFAGSVSTPRAFNQSSSRAFSLSIIIGKMFCSCACLAILPEHK